MKKPVLLLLSLCASLLSFSQFIISGSVVDAETKEPLQGASVFAQNTTKGTVTDKEGKFRLPLNKGGYELIVSFTGYSNKNINLEVVEDRQFTLELQKADNSMSEIVIKSSSEVPDGWEKYGKFFLDHFIGTTPFADSCTLLNKEALKFFYYKRTDRLKILATEPLQVQNNALGYTLRYQLDSFVYYFKTDIGSYGGVCLYMPQEGTEAQQSLWKTNRQQAYYGSKLHFLRSYYDSTLKQEGFVIDIPATGKTPKYNELRNPYDTTYYFYDDSTGNAELWLPSKTGITFTKQSPDKRYLKQSGLALNIPTQISYVDLKDAILIMPNGYFTEQKSWVNQGYWSWKNVADGLPYDYEPGL